MDNRPKILVLDIETAPAELLGWGMFKQNFGVSQVKKYPYILCIGYKWLHEKEVYCDTIWDMTPKEMLQKILDLITESDAILTKNGIKFDVAWIRTELAKNEMPPLPPLTHIDLEKVVRAYFRFLSNKLEGIGDYLDLGHKVQHEGFPLWDKVMQGDPYARRRMVRYCKGDVRLTQRIYKRLKPHIADHPALRAVGAEGCTACGSHDTQMRGFRYTRMFRIQRHQCNSCHSWFSGKRKKIA